MLETIRQEIAGRSNTIVVKVVKAGPTGAKRVDIDAFVVMP